MGSNVLLQKSLQVLPWKATAVWDHLQEEMSSMVATPMPPRALKIKYTDLQLEPICWETNEGALITVTFHPCLTILINYFILKNLLLSQTLGFTVLTAGNGSRHVDQHYCAHWCYSSWQTEGKYSNSGRCSKEELLLNIPVNNITKQKSRFSHIGAQKTRSIGSEQYGIF